MDRHVPKLASATSCTGCFACKAACPHGAISPLRNEYGFLVPCIDPNQCRSCGLCESACPVVHVREQRAALPTCFAAHSLDEAIRLSSSSGGIFSELAAETLASSGCVFGCVMDRGTLLPVHVKAESADELNAMRGSKYVQSDLRDTFRQCKEELAKGRKVLFSGAPCQIAGLKSYLRNDDDNLLTVDVICHGVPSPAVFAKYKRDMEAKAKSSLTKVAFRDKIVSWILFSMRLSFVDSRKDCTATVCEDVFLRTFLTDLPLRESCFNCPTKCGRSGADVTLADFWGIDKVLPDWDYQNGVSAVLVHTDKGMRSFDGIRGRIKHAQVDAEALLSMQPSYSRSVARPKNRDKYMRGFESHALEPWLVYCTCGPLWLRLVRRLYRVVIGRFR